MPLTGSSHLVVHAVEQSRHHGEDGRPQGLHVVWKEADVALIEADPPSVAVHHRLQRHTRMLSSVPRRSPPSDSAEAAKRAYRFHNRYFRTKVHVGKSYIDHIVYGRRLNAQLSEVSAALTPQSDAELTDIY